ncbi:hypothetical protein KJ903_02630 [Patescibacteria group bacterium]|nr:hypothetical protein [Patescibacteria group bacterium]
MPKKKVAIICGGITDERGISLNSARSLYDNLDQDKYELSLFYFNPKLEAYEITPGEVYSNTPLDFDYKLKHGGQALSGKELGERLKKIDLVFPAIHGLFGEDGQLQSLLEEYGVKYVGSPPVSCRDTSDKYKCQQILAKHGFHTKPSWVVKKGETVPDLPLGKYVAKPLHGGSSIGIEYIKNITDINGALEKVWQIEEEAIIEPLCEDREFTIIVLDNDRGGSVALLPTEIEFSRVNVNFDRFFSYRKKYLPTTEIRYHTPARFNQKEIAKIREESTRAFQILGMKDFARIDGWLLDDGTIWLSDINAVSGMEQNSFLFQQAAALGLNHRQLLDYIINKKVTAAAAEKREMIPVIFGGKTAERQVSVISGTNVYMKLKSSQAYKPIPLFLSADDKIFRIPHFLCLHHTAEEIEEKIDLLHDVDFIGSINSWQKKILSQLGIGAGEIAEPLFVPELLTLEKIAEKYNFLFLGLHGGEGEDGTLQKKLNNLKLPYNGPGANCSHLCMDKYETGQEVTRAKLPGVRTAHKIIVDVNQPQKVLTRVLEDKKLDFPLIIKPRDDGCSAGVVRVDNREELDKAIEYLGSDALYILAGEISSGQEQIELSGEPLTEVLIEECILTDKVNLRNLEIQWQSVSDIIEVTIGMFGHRESIHAFNPSQTIVNSQVLSLEEKFMGGTGINLTPPPGQYVTESAVATAKKRAEEIAEKLGIEGYARIDAFMNVKTGELIIIEVNTLPALTPSTVLFHQALQEELSLMPLDLVEKLIELGKERFKG